MRNLARSAPCLTIALACLCLAALPARAADAEATRRAVDNVVVPLMAQHGVPGMAVAVTVNGKAMFFNYGLASRQDKTPVTQDTLFELGSISKAFTATLALYASETGKLSMDDHPGKYVTRLKGSAIDKASLLELGTYTAGGLPLQFPSGTGDGEPVLAYLSQWKPDAALGMVRRYSNPSIGLLGHVTASALKVDFSDALEQQLFPALGLKQSYVRVPASVSSLYAWGYDSENMPVRVGHGPFGAEAYGIKSTSADLIRFVQKNLDPRHLTGPLRRAVEGTHIGYFEVGPMIQGLGWEQYRPPLALDRLLTGNSEAIVLESNPARKLTPPQPAPSGTFFNKTGSTRGFGAYAAFIPEQKIGIVMLANKNYPIPARIRAAHAILEQLASSGHVEPKD